jgi:hypothetical protein
MKKILAALAFLTVAICTTTTIKAQTYKTDWATQVTLAGGGNNLGQIITLKAATPAASFTYSLSDAPGTTGYVLQATTIAGGVSTLSWVNPATAANAWNLNGNASSAANFLGTTDATNPLLIKTNSLTRMTISAAGGVNFNTLNTGTAGVVHSSSAGDISNSLIVNADITPATIDLTTKVTGVLPIANGGTNSGAALTASAIAVSNGTALVQGPLGTVTTVLHGNAAGLPTYGQIVNADITNGTIDLTSKVTGILPPVNGGTGVANLNTSTITLGGPLTLSGAFATTLTVTGTTSVILPTTGTLLSSGGGFTTDGVIYASSATAITSTGAGISGQVLTSNGAGVAPTFQAAGGTITLSPSAANNPGAGPWNNFTTNSNNSVYYLQNTTGANVNMTGISGGTADRLIVLVNNSSGTANSITLKDKTNTSTDVNEFHLQGGADIILGVDGTVTLIYDSGATNTTGTTGAWRVISAQ